MKAEEINRNAKYAKETFGLTDEADDALKALNIIFIIFLAFFSKLY